MAALEEDLEALRNTLPSVIGIVQYILEQNDELHIAVKPDAFLRILEQVVSVPRGY